MLKTSKSLPNLLLVLLFPSFPITGVLSQVTDSEVALRKEKTKGKLKTMFGEDTPTPPSSDPKKTEEVRAPNLSRNIPDESLLILLPKKNQTL